jgi:hypothetical protein
MLYQDPGRAPGFSETSKKKKSSLCLYNPMGAQRRKQGTKYSLSSSIAFTPNINLKLASNRKEVVWKQTSWRRINQEYEIITVSA